MPTSDMRWTIVVHGGARQIPTKDRYRFARGCQTAADLGGRILAQGGTAIDAVEAAVRFLEDQPQFNAGIGSVRNGDGEVEMDAAIMNGSNLALGGVGALKNVRHPVSVARALLDEKPVLLVGDGAQRFAKAIGAEQVRPDAGANQSAGAGGCDTVGCVARDQHGHLAAAGSTGGLEGKMAGRVGDTPLPGCGLYADDRSGAVALSGEGESIARGMLAAHALFTLPSAGPQVAAQASIDRLARTGGEAGIILLGPDGGFAVAHNSNQFAIGLAAHDIEGARGATHADEFKEWFL